MTKYLVILLLAVALMVPAGCGEAPATEEPAETAEPIEAPIEEILVISPHSDPGNLTLFRDQTDEVMYFLVTGNETGSVWGTDIFTDDSYLETAAVHAGVLAPGETDVVKVTLLPGEESYEGTIRNDITSMSYGAWSGSYLVEAVLVDYEIAALADPGNLTSYRDHTGESFSFQVTGDAWASIWGTDIYTDDSNLAAAAVHAGVLEDEETGVVVVTILPGEESYTGSTRNDVTSWDYGSWSGSYTVE